MCGGSGGGGGSGGDMSKNGDAGQPGEVFRASQIMLDNLRSGKLSQKDAEAAADALLTASMKSRNFEETRAINKKYAAAMDAIDAYKAERGTMKPAAEKSNYQIRLEQSRRDQYESAKAVKEFRKKVPTIFGSTPEKTYKNY